MKFKNELCTLCGIIVPVSVEYKPKYSFSDSELPTNPIVCDCCKDDINEESEEG